MKSATDYLDNEVRNATPQQLRRILIEGALRFAHTTRAHLVANETSLAEAAKSRCRGILAELLDSIHGEHEVADQMRALYAVLITSYMTQDAINPIKAVENLIAGLNEELKTWTKVCEVHPHLPQELVDARAGSRELTSEEAATILDQTPGEAHQAPRNTRGNAFRIDA